ncbi:hypothetical protein PG993_003864 [Apiospora rasikravindrae]|uniref:Oxidase ustYa n=1 Tax=Apiospora rasikravindrae TaxID=990691 RepID=A0ABR1U0Q5_9PEZI
MADREELLSASSRENQEKYEWTNTAGAAKWSERRTFMHTLQSFSWLVNMVLLTINTIGLLYLLHYAGASTVQVGGDYTNQGPTFSTTIQRWKADPDFTPLTETEFLKPKTQANHCARRLTCSSFPVAGSDFGEDGKVYNTTSVTHQIHCVYIMAKIFSSVLSNSTDIGIPSDYEAHFLHCVDYLRQAAMCAGDVALEPRSDEDGKPGAVTLENAFNGYHGKGVPIAC